MPDIFVAILLFNSVFLLAITNPVKCQLPKDPLIRLWPTCGFSLYKHSIVNAQHCFQFPENWVAAQIQIGFPQLTPLCLHQICLCGCLVWGLTTPVQTTHTSPLSQSFPSEKSRSWKIVTKLDITKCKQAYTFISGLDELTQLEKIGPTTGKSQNYTHSHCKESDKNYKLKNNNLYVGGLIKKCAGSMIDASVSEPPWVLLTWFCGPFSCCPWPFWFI